MRAKPLFVLVPAACLALAGAQSTSHAQDAKKAFPGRGMQQPRIVSVETANDHKVTFRIRAPKATEVTVAGDWGNAPLKKDDQGVWSATVGPLTPDFYTYTFVVDGVRTPDAQNPLVKPGLAGIDSMFEVPGAEEEFEATKDVPHGTIRIDWYKSKALDALRSVHVYTPPGYEAGSEKYPVLYLLHGAGDTDTGWSTIGRAGFILDNLIAAKKAKPMIIVMPNGSMPRPTNMPRVQPGTQPTPEVRAAMAAAQNRFTDELLDNVVPFAESHYRIQGGAEHRAIAGLSMGGGQTLRVLTTHPDAFSYVAIWSAGLFGGSPDDFEKGNAEFFAKSSSLGDKVKLVSICVGDQDFALNGSKALSELFNKHSIKHELHISGGGHTWINWRHYLSELAPRLFQ